MAATIATEAPVSAAKPWYRVLYVQVLIAIVLGALFGWLWPALATTTGSKGARRRFIKLIKMVIAPIIFCHRGIRNSAYTRCQEGGRILRQGAGLFRGRSHFALGDRSAHRQSGQAGRGVRRRHGERATVAGYAKQAEAQKSVDFFLHIIPDTVVGAFAQGEILQVLLFSILFGLR